MQPIVLALLCLAALLSACTLPESTGMVRVCIPDSGFCHFEERK
jgi:hypothetical protein